MKRTYDQFAEWMRDPENAKRFFQFVEEKGVDLNQCMETADSDTDASYEDEPGNYQTPAHQPGSIDFLNKIVTLGHYITGERFDMDNQKIDLTFYHASVDTNALREAIARAYAYITQKMSRLGHREVNLKTIRHLRVKENSKDLVTNIMAGRTQLGKTETIAACLYLSAIGLGVVAIGLTRSPGGDETINSLKSTIEELSNDVVEYLKITIENINDLVLDFFKPEVYKAQDFCKRFSPEQLQGRHRGLILVDRQNTTTLERLFLDSQAPLAQRNEMRFANGLMKYVLIIDEDDEAAASAARNKTKTEQKSFSNHMPVAASTSEDEDEEEDGDDGDEQANFDLSQINPTVRGQAFMIVAATATWIALTMVDQGISQPLKIIELPLKRSYVGLFPNQTHDNARSVKWENVPEAIDSRDVNQAYEKPLDHVMQRLNTRYKYIRNGDPRLDGQHISLHINTAKTKITKNAEDMCSKLVEVHKDVPLLAFAWNANKERYIYASAKLVSKLNQANTGLATIVQVVIQNKFRELISEQQIEPKVVRHDLAKVSFTLPKKLRLISTMYDIVKRVFETCNIPPFVICVSGHMGNRGLTLKDSSRKLVLTDQLYDVAQSTRSQNHYELVVQTAGRICSVDDLKSFKRTIWLTPSAENELRAALKFYEEIMAIVKQDSHRLWSLQDLLEKTKTTDRAIIDVAEGKLATRRALQAPMQDMMIEAIQQSPADTSSMSELFDVIAQIVQNQPNGLTVEEIKEKLTPLGYNKSLAEINNICMGDARNTIYPIQRAGIFYMTHSDYIHV